MSDVVVTVPLRFGWQRWIEEGDAAGEPWSGQLWAFSLGGPVPRIRPGERVYVVHAGRLRGYAPLVRMDREGTGCALVRGGLAVPCTLEQHVTGFRGFRYRWWPYADERPFPGWRDL